MTQPLILVSNDDGITSAGIRNLVEVMKQLGDVLVVAPDSPQSGMGHAITVGETLRLDETSIFEGVRSFECSGTPADCVKMARHFVLKDEREPDVIVSGINHGSNTSISVCRQANAKWVEEFDQRFDPNKRRYFWMTGNFVNFDKGEDNDEWAIANNYVSVVPCQFDLTAHHAIPVLNDEWDVLG
jgi:broad specificity polyphosphatase/5'/3'-nucleotidase SurE